MDQHFCAVLADVVRRFGGRVRFKLRCETEAEPWSRWLGAPSDGYIEIEGYGPSQLGELEWVEAEPEGDVELLASALAAVGIPAAVIQDTVRVTI
jgi:hypothetical protein